MRYYLAIVVEGEGEVVVVFPVSGLVFLWERRMVLMFESGNADDITEQGDCGGSVEGGEGVFV